MLVYFLLLVGQGNRFNHDQIASTNEIFAGSELNRPSCPLFSHSLLLPILFICNWNQAQTIESFIKNMKLIAYIYTHIYIYIYIYIYMNWCVRSIFVQFKRISITRSHIPIPNLVSHNSVSRRCRLANFIGYINFERSSHLLCPRTEDFPNWVNVRFDENSTTKLPVQYSDNVFFGEFCVKFMSSTCTLVFH